MRTGYQDGSGAARYGRRRKEGRKEGRKGREHTACFVLQRGIEKRDDLCLIMHSAAFSVLGGVRRLLRA
jgi:hypothetical protein